MSLADLWGPEEPAVEVFERSEPTSPTVIDAEPTEPDSEPFPPCSDEQWAEIQQYVSPRAKASLHRDKLDFDTAEQIIAEWKPKR